MRVRADTPLVILLDIRKGDTIEDALGNREIVRETELLPCGGKLLIRFGLGNHDLILIR